MGYLGLVSHMGLMGFRKAKDARRGTAPQRDESKPAGVAFWGDDPTAADIANDRYEPVNWPPQPAANDHWPPQPPASDHWPPQPPANDGREWPPAAPASKPAPPAADRQRGGRHARRNPGHHGGAGHRARASLAGRPFG